MKTSTAILLLVIAPLSEAQQVPELLRPVSADKAQRLIEYNSTWLQAQLYSARRFRVVTPDTSLLLKNDDFTVTPFDDLPPIHLRQLSVQSWDDSVAWLAVMQLDLPPIIEAMGLKATTLLSMMAWDTDESGNALESWDNRFAHSEYWTFDSADRPILEAPLGEAVIAGPPPETPDEVARHKQLKKLRKHAFYSVQAAFEMPGGAKYMLVPLKYAPKYAVIFEVDPARDVPFVLDSPPEGQVVIRSAADDAKLIAYEDFMRTLPPETDVPVVEDVQ